MRFSKTTMGFYPESVDYPNLPDDLVTIEDSYQLELLANTDPNLELGVDKNGYPVLIPCTTKPIEELRPYMQLSAAEARIKLAQMGLLMQVLETINGLPDDNFLKIKWEYSAILHRLDPILVAFCRDEFKMDDVQIDTLFA